MVKKTESSNNEATAKAPETSFEIQKIYVKESSYEASANTPAIFRGDWKPQVHLELNSTNEALSDNVYEVIVSMTVTVKIDDPDTKKEPKTAFLIEVKQAGIFTIRGLEKDKLDHTLGSFCPNVIFPYLRETISDMVVRGGFPQLNLAPINFDAIYEEIKKQKQAKEASSDAN